MLKLTPKNYYTKANTYISSSKLGTFIKDKNLFYRKYREWSVEQEKTDALIIGSAVDCLLTGTKTKFDKEFVVVERRSSKTDDERMQINLSMLDKINGIVNSVKRQEIWQDLKKKEWKKQVILSDDELEICGMLDFLKIDGDTATIVDLKTSNTIDCKKYYWHCLDYNYFLQLAFYRKLVRKNFPQVNKVKCYHLTVEKDPDELYNCAVFEIWNELIDVFEKEMDVFLQILRAETDFSPKSVGWQDVILISPLN